MNNNSADTSELCSVREPEGGREVERRVGPVLCLVEGAVGDDLRDVVGHSGVVKGQSGGDGHEFGEQYILD